MTKEDQQMRKLIAEITAVHTNTIADLIESVAGDFTYLSTPEVLRRFANLLRQTSKDLNSTPREENDNVNSK